MTDNSSCSQYKYHGLYHGSEGTSCRGCNKNLASNEPASQYQRQKIIQNTVRVKSSLYTMNLAALSGYHKPNSSYSMVNLEASSYIVSPGVNWNQMSDQANPSKQIVKTANGTTYHASSTKHTITRLRPGALSPGGIGVDIKHNSYESYLNRLKGRGPLKRGVIPITYGQPIPFSLVHPVYGGKTIKTGIINGCDCGDPQLNQKLIYKDGRQNEIYDAEGVEAGAEAGAEAGESLPKIAPSKTAEAGDKPAKAGDKPAKAGDKPAKAGD